MIEGKYKYKNSDGSVFLENYRFRMNNIGFRISVCNYLSGWKNNKAYHLNQVMDESKFSKEQREIMILNYDVWGHFVFWLEDFFISNFEKKIMTDNMFNTIGQHMDIVADKIQEIMNIAETVFTNKQKCKSFANVIFKDGELFEYFKKNFEKTKGNDLLDGFKFIIENLVKLMENVLYILNELNTLRENKTTPFLAFTKFDLQTIDAFEQCLMSKRLAVYKNTYNVQEVFIKNYASKPIPDFVFDEIENCGVKIDHRKSY